MQPPKHSKHLRAVDFYFGNSGGYVIWGLMTICAPSLGMECEKMSVIDTRCKLQSVGKGRRLHRGRYGGPGSTWTVDVECGREVSRVSKL